jgi:hypothetical protein
LFRSSQLYGLYKTALNDPHFSAVESKKPWAMDIVSLPP